MGAVGAAVAEEGEAHVSQFLLPVPIRALWASALRWTEVRSSHTHYCLSRVDCKGYLPG